MDETIMRDAPPGSVLLCLEDANATFVGYCQPVTEHDPTPVFDSNWFVGIMQPIRVVQGIKSLPGGQAEKVFNSFPASVVDWVDVLFVRPTRYYLAGPATAKVHQDSWASFIQEYERNQAEAAGIVLVTSDQARQINEMHAKMRRH
jgi:hypothetical protein